MTVLLDTHVFVWALVAPELLSRKAEVTLKSVATRAFVSAVSAYEVAAKVRLGKWPEAAFLLDEFEQAMAGAGYESLSVSQSVALRAGHMPGEHRDPFDRLLAASALELDVPVISADPALDTFGVRRIW